MALGHIIALLFFSAVGSLGVAAIQKALADAFRRVGEPDVPRRRTPRGHYRQAKAGQAGSGGQENVSAAA